MNVNTLEFKYIRMYLNTNTENENSIPSNDIPVQTRAGMAEAEDTREAASRSVTPQTQPPGNE